MSITVNALPEELWRLILGFATDQDPKSMTYSTATDMLPPIGVKSMLQKTTLSLVSRYFREMFPQFLYEAIKISDRGKLESLCHGSHREHFNLHTVYIAIFASNEKIRQEDWPKIVELIAMCGRLQVFNISCTDNPWHSVPKSMAISLVDALSQTLTCLIWNVGPGYRYLADAIFYLLARSRSLRILQVRRRAPILPETGSFAPKSETLALEQLSHLYVDDTADVFSTDLRQRWHTPRLARVTTKKLSEMKMCMQSVTYLEISEPYHAYGSGLNLAQLYHAFPNLQQLLYTVSAAIPSQLFQRRIQNPHPTLSTIVLTLCATQCAEDVFWRNLAAHLHSIHLAALPSLEMVVVRNLSAYKHCRGPESVRLALADPAALFRSGNVELRSEL